MARRTPPKKRFNDQETNGFARALWIFVHFFAVLCKQQREMTKFCVVWRTKTAAANFSYFYLEFNAGMTRLAWLGTESNRPWTDLYSCEIPRWNINSFFFLNSSLVVYSRHESNAFYHCSSGLTADVWNMLNRLKYSFQINLTQSQVYFTWRSVTCSILLDCCSYTILILANTSEVIAKVISVCL